MKRWLVWALDATADGLSWLPRGYRLSRRVALWSLALDDRWAVGHWKHAWGDRR